MSEKPFERFKRHAREKEKTPNKVFKFGAEEEKPKKVRKSRTKKKKNADPEDWDGEIQTT